MKIPLSSMTTKVHRPSTLRKEKGASSLVAEKQEMNSCLIRIRTSLPQAGKTCKNVLGSMAYLARKLNGDNSMPIKQSARGCAPCSGFARPAWYGESYTTLISVSGGPLSGLSVKAHETDTDATAVFLLDGSNLQHQQRNTIGILKKRTRHLPHATTCPLADHRMAYRARAPRSRSSHSSPRTGKPSTWRRGTGS